MALTNKMQQQLMLCCYAVGDVFAAMGATLLRSLGIIRTCAIMA
jgi:hypothetical protein